MAIMKRIRGPEVVLRPLTLDGTVPQLCTNNASLINRSLAITGFGSFEIYFSGTSVGYEHTPYTPRSADPNVRSKLVGTFTKFLRAWMLYCASRQDWITTGTGIGLLDLPVKVRNMIWTYAVAENPEVGPPQGDCVCHSRASGGVFGDLGTNLTWATTAGN